jgi:hypothetical protein
MVDPLIAAVPPAAIKGPPAVVSRAPGSREFLNWCPLMPTAGNTGVLLALMGTFGGDT